MLGLSLVNGPMTSLLGLNMLGLVVTNVWHLRLLLYNVLCSRWQCWAGPSLLNSRRLSPSNLPDPWHLCFVRGP